MIQINRLARAPIAIVLLLGGALLQAQPGSPARQGPPPADAQPRFKIELIVFRYEAGNAAEEDLSHGRAPVDAPRRLQLPGIDLATVFDDPESSPELPPAETVTGDALELIDPAAYEAGRVSGSRPPDLPPSFQRLRQDELALGAARSRLDGLSAYTVLAHTGWIQAGVDGQAAPWLDLRYLGLTNPTGSVRIRRGRFFFVTLDLMVHDERNVTWNPATNAELMPLARGSVYPFEHEKSGIREGRLEYFDHPLFGVLVQITPVADEEDGERPAA